MRKKRQNLKFSSQSQSPYSSEEISPSQLFLYPSSILYCISYILPVLVMSQAKKINRAIHLVFFFNLVEFLFPLMLERWCPCCQLWWRIICISHQKPGRDFQEFQKGLIYSHFLALSWFLFKNLLFHRLGIFVKCNLTLPERCISGNILDEHQKKCGVGCWATS